MPQKSLPVTLDHANVAWLKSLARRTGVSVSVALDRLVTHARTGDSPVVPTSSSVIGMVDLSDDPTLAKADAAVRDGFEEYASRHPQFRFR